MLLVLCYFFYGMIFNLRFLDDFWLLIEVFFILMSDFCE